MYRRDSYINVNTGYTDSSLFEKSVVAELVKIFPTNYEFF
jgi:hypothetical protein